MRVTGVLVEYSDTERDLRSIYETVTGQTADQSAIHRCGLVIVQMLLPGWSPGRRLTVAQAAEVGRIYSWLLGDTRGARGNFSRWTLAEQRRHVAALRSRFQWQLGVAA